MPVYTVWGHRDRIDAAFERASQVADRPEIQADLARFLVVLTSGFLEKAISHTYSVYASGAGSTQLVRYAHRRLETFQNPNAEKILQLAGDFDSEWREALEDYLGDQRKDHIDSVVANRNQIAHGANVGVTYGRAEEYFRSAKEVVSFIGSLCSS